MPLAQSAALKRRITRTGTVRECGCGGSRRRASSTIRRSEFLFGSIQLMAYLRFYPCRHPIPGATCRKIASITCALVSTPSWFGPSERVGPRRWPRRISARRSAPPARRSGPRYRISPRSRGRSTPARSTSPGVRARAPAVSRRATRPIMRWSARRRIGTRPTLSVAMRSPSCPVSSSSKPMTIASPADISPRVAPAAHPCVRERSTSAGPTMPTPRVFPPYGIALATPLPPCRDRVF